VLITESIISEANFILPELYLKQYDGWYCKSKGLMIYRSKSLAEMNKIGLVQLLDKPTSINSGKTVVAVKDSRIIEQNYRK
jgi:hypothetical protein